jgi:hypothetical protein
MSNLTNIAQFMPQGIKGPKRLLQQAAMGKWNEIKPKANAGNRSQIEEYLQLLCAVRGVLFRCAVCYFISLVVI